MRFSKAGPIPSRSVCLRRRGPRTSRKLLFCAAFAAIAWLPGRGAAQTPEDGAAKASRALGAQNEHRPLDESAPTPPEMSGRPRWLQDGEEAFALNAVGGIRGLTVGPIESLRHPGVGYGSEAFGRALDETVAMGGTWVSLTPFGRVWNLESTEVSLEFEAPFEQNRKNVLLGIQMARARGLKVLVVPHLWVESGEWRALIDPKTDDGWAKWADSYGSFLATWARVAEEGGAEMLSVGVELRSWVTTSRAHLFVPILKKVRHLYSGMLTYSANWDDVDETLILQEMDVIGINAFYPLADEEGASLQTLMAGGVKVKDRLSKLAHFERKPILLTEIGYKTVEDPAVKPWIWPENMEKVVLSQRAQAEATFALVEPLLSQPWFAGFFVWRIYADPDDVSQEAEFGFSPRGKWAERVIRDAFTAIWAADGPRGLLTPIGRHKATSHGVWNSGPPIGRARIFGVRDLLFQ